MPWLTALRTRWSIGSIIRSTRNLSISVAWPARSELNAFAVVARQIADDERHPPEHLADRDQAHPHDAFAQIAKMPLDALAVLLQDAPFRRRRITLDAQQRVLEPRTRDDQIADQPHQIVEAGQIDAHEIRPADR